MTIDQQECEKRRMRPPKAGPELLVELAPGSLQALPMIATAASSFSDITGVGRSPASQMLWPPKDPPK